MSKRVVHSPYLPLDMGVLDWGEDGVLMGETGSERDESYMAPYIYPSPHQHFM
jgi:hypothetical protein